MNHRAILKRLDEISGEIYKKAVLPEAVIVRKTGDEYHVRIIRHAVNASRDDLTVTRILNDPREYTPPEGFRGPVIHLYRGGKKECKSQAKPCFSPIL